MTSAFDTATRLADELGKGLVPSGKLAEYGSVADKLGVTPQEAGFACRTLGLHPETRGLPFHRIICKYGRLPGSFSAGGIPRLVELLEQEGHEVQLADKGYTVLDFQDYLQEH